MAPASMLEAGRRPSRLSRLLLHMSSSARRPRPHGPRSRCRVVADDLLRPRPLPRSAVSSARQYPSEAPDRVWTVLAPPLCPRLRTGVLGSARPLLGRGTLSSLADDRPSSVSDPLLRPAHRFSASKSPRSIVAGSLKVALWISPATTVDKNSRSSMRERPTTQGMAVRLSPAKTFIPGRGQLL